MPPLPLPCMDPHMLQKSTISTLAVCLWRVLHFSTYKNAHLLNFRLVQRPLSTLLSSSSVHAQPVSLSHNNNNNHSKSDWTLDKTPISHWSRSTPSDSTSGGSPSSYRIMPPPPPPQSKKPVTCKIHFFSKLDFFPFTFSF